MRVSPVYKGQRLFYSLGQFAYRRRWAVIVVWIVLLAAAAPLLPQATDRLQFGGFSSPRMESERARQLLERSLGLQPSSLVVLFTSPSLTADDPEFGRQVAYAVAGLQGAPGVDRVVDHLTNPRQISRDRHTAYELVVLSVDAEAAARGLSAITSRLRDPSGDSGTGRRGDSETWGWGDGGSPQPLPLPLGEEDPAALSAQNPELSSQNSALSSQNSALSSQNSALSTQDSALRMLVTGGPVFFSEVERLSHEDLLRAEIVAFPFAAVALVMVFGSLAAAGLPIALGGATVVGITAAIALLSRVTDLSIFVINVATMLGLGLGVDYSLFMTSRFREELIKSHRENGSRAHPSLHPDCLPRGEGEDRGKSNALAGSAAVSAARAGRMPALPAGLAGDLGVSPSRLTTLPESSQDVGEAVASTVATAGKAVFFSGLSVLIGLAGLSSFEFMLLRSLGIVGMIGIALCVAAALTLLPAILGVLGPNVNRWPVLVGRFGISGFWERSAAWVMRHPVAVFVPTLALLIALGTPFLHVRFSAPDAYILPPDLPSRQALDLLRREFGESETAPLLVVVQAKGNVLEPENLSTLYDFTHTLSRDPRVASIESPVDLDPRITRAQYRLLYADPTHIGDIYAREVSRITASGSVALVKVATRQAPVSEESKDLVRQIRATSLPNGMTLQVAGTTAEVIDVVDTLYADAPRALIFVVAAIYLILFGLFRSVLLPAKAIVMNTLSILASYGALVYIFQDGHFQTQLRFRSEGSVEASMPIIMFCILFGLSMDYEVFLLTRIKEEYERTGDNTLSVAKGLERSGKIITSAAIIVVVVGVAFAAADIVIIKALGLGIAIAVFLDATVVRTLLVPATMRLLGKWNWWAPGRPPKSDEKK